MTERAESAALTAATLELRGVVFRGAESGLAAPLSLRSEAQRVGLVGDWEPFFRALTEHSGFEQGSAQILDLELHAALSEGLLGLAACDPALPGSFTVREYLEHAARLSHGSARRAKEDASRALNELGLTELSTKKLATLVTHQRRALGIALATLTVPPVVCLETPLRGLDVAAADYITRLCAHAARNSRLIVSSLLPSTPSPERALLDECQELFRLERGVLVAHGSPEAVLAPSARYFVTLSGSENRALIAALTAAGCRLAEQPDSSTLSAWVEPGRPIARYLVELPDGATSDLLLDAALAAGAVVLELEPVLGFSRAS